MGTRIKVMAFLDDSTHAHTNVPIYDIDFSCHTADREFADVEFDLCLGIFIYWYM